MHSREKIDLYFSFFFIFHVFPFVLLISVWYYIYIYIYTYFVLFCRELVSYLQERNVQVFLISGGFRSIVEHVASKLNIPLTNVFANKLKFYFNGKIFPFLLSFIFQYSR